MTKQELFKEYQDYLKQGITPELLILDIHMPGGETENIINPNVADKMSYIDRTYDEDLVHRNCKDIFITDAIFVIPGGYGMDFDGAMKAMLEGAKVKLPTWGGYWYWDEQQRTVMMHTKDGKELDIRSTQDVFYTMRNICSDEWILADETNCPQINPAAVPVFSFADAIRFIRAGKKVSRQSWNGKGQYVFLADDVSFTTEADLSEFHKPEDDTVHVSAMLVLRTAQGTFQPGWLATQSDMLADDWYLVPDNANKKAE